MISERIERIIYPRSSNLMHDLDDYFHVDNRGNYASKKQTIKCYQGKERKERITTELTNKL